MNSNESQVTIANAALGKCGVAVITSLFPPDANSKGAIRASKVYNQLRDYCLAQHSWTFAKKTVALSQLATTTNWLTNTSYAIGQYANRGGSTYLCLVAHMSGTFNTDLVAGYWAVQAVGISLILVDFGDGANVAYAYPSDWIKPVKWNYPQAIIRLEDNIYSDTPGLKVKYTFQNDNPATYSPEFIEAFATKIAAEICYDLTNNAAKAKELRDEFDDKLAQAIAADSMGDTPDQAIQDEWLTARLAGAQGPLPLPGEGMIGFYSDGTV